MQNTILVIRDVFSDDTTIGKMYINGEYLCYTLEDAVRPYKIYGETAIPAGCYNVELTPSPRFKRQMPLIYNTEEKTVNRFGMEFKGVRIHGGNNHENTEGCILVAYNKISNKMIQETAEAAVTAFLNTHKNVLLIITEKWN